MKQSLWPGWETTRLIGRGSFGAVYEIERKLFDDDEPEKAALKVISIPQNASDIDEMYMDGLDAESITDTFKSHLKSIVAEYSLMRKMNGCTNIVNCDDVHYVQHDNGIGWDIYIKMELLTPLGKSLPAEMPEETVIKIAKDMCNALAVCKEFNIVHRDIKPQNIFVSQYGDYKLGDFGIAKTVEKTMGGTKIGTYKYMAPEVYNSQPYGASADIYSLGLVLYWMLNERRMPFLPPAPEKLKVGMEERARNRRLRGEMLNYPKNGSRRFQDIVMKACAPNPEDRYASATEMLVALNALKEERASEPRPIPTPSPKPVPQLPPTPVSTPDPKPESSTTLRERRVWKNITWMGVVAAVVVIGGILLIAFGVGISKNTSISKSNADEPTISTLGQSLQNVTEHAHTWLEATCISPKMCSTCGETVGTFGHQWIDATYHEPKTCSICGMTEGAVLTPEPVYINELTCCDKYGKLWTMSEQTPNYYVHSDISSGTAYQDMTTPGHTTGMVCDYLGNQYTYGLTIDGSEYAEYYISYDIGGIYSRFEGACSMSQDLKGTSYASSFSKFFEVYGDGKLLFRSAEISQGSNSQEFCIDVSNVEILTILYPLEYQKSSGPSRMATIFDGMLS